jgi:hypothetical protein
VKTSTKSGEKVQRQNIFNNNNKPNISADFFGNDIAGFIKK